MENKQLVVEQEIKTWVQKYNVLCKNQLYSYFSKTGCEKFVGKALRTLEKERIVYINQDTQQIASSETAYKAWDRGTHQAIWVLLDIMDQKKVELHFLASPDEFPIRVICVGDATIYDIVFVPGEDIQLANNLFERRKIGDCEHIIIVEKAEDIAAINIPDVVGFCTVKEDGKVEYYRKNQSTT